MEKNEHYEQINLDLESNFKNELPIIISWNIEARYQDYKDRFYKLCNKEYKEKKLKIVENLMKCLTKVL